ncbi:hypothetical protein OEZ86_004918 [Tetradesmus obliquus]|nr:hypothetical protein OEZ86_004918 [Tetradesmus obliquus]
MAGPRASWLRSRKAFLADQAREAAGGRGHQQQQQLEGPGSPACGTEHPEKDAPETPNAPDPDAAATAAALLAYHSPFRRRTITVKVQAPEEGTQEPGFDPAARLTAAVQAAVAALPGGERTVIANQRCEELVAACHQALLAAYASQASS